MHLVNVVVERFDHLRWPCQLQEEGTVVPIMPFQRSRTQLEFFPTATAEFFKTMFNKSVSNQRNLLILLLLIYLRVAKCQIFHNVPKSDTWETLTKRQCKHMV